MAIAATPRITPEDFLRLPDDGLGFELVDGELRERNVSQFASWVAGFMLIELGIYCRATRAGWVFPEGVSYRCFPDYPDQIRRADVSFFAFDRKTSAYCRTDGFDTSVPDMVVEVVSPNDTAREVGKKNKEWLSAGVRLLWVIDPDNEFVHVHRSDGSMIQLRVGDTLSGEDVLPGFTCPVADLFRLPDETT